MDEKSKLSIGFIFGIIVLAALFLVTTNNSSGIYGTNTASTSTINSTANGSVYTPQQELVNVQKVDPNANISTFYCTTSSQCTIVHTSACFNNEPSQQACINQNYENSYSNYFNQFRNVSQPCPQFILAGTASCSCINNGCSLVFQNN